MTKDTKVLLGAMAIILIAVVGLAITPRTNKTNSFIAQTAENLKIGSAQTTATYATATEVTPLPGLYLYSTDSNSGLEVKGPTYLAALTASGLLTGSAGITISAGDSVLYNLIGAGAVTGFTASTTSATANRLSAANICAQTYVPITLGNTTTMTLYTPTVASLFSNCLTSNGSYKDVVLKNIETVSTTFIYDSETSSTIHYSSSSTLGAGDTMLIRFLRTAANNLEILVTNQEN